jgi:nicotinate-nucleotide adenylyltransferase
MARRIGIFSGTFDPVHQGHIAFCLEALRICKLDEIFLMPEQTPRGKQQVTPLPQRMALLQEVIARHPALHTLVLDTRQFTVRHTLPELQHRFKGDELTLLIGSDVAHTLLHRWDGLKTLLTQVSLAIGVRQGDTQTAMRDLMQQVGHDYDVPVRHTLIQSPLAGLSSSQIRQQAPISSHDR